MTRVFDGIQDFSSSTLVSGTTRVTSSPYAVLITDYGIYVDTDGGDITVNLPAGTDGTVHRIINSGS